MNHPGRAGTCHRCQQPLGAPASPTLRVPASANSGYGADVSPEENKALVRRFYDEIDQGNLSAMDELVAEDYVNHHPPPFPGLPAGREGLKQAFKIFWEATPGH